MVIMVRVGVMVKVRVGVRIRNWFGRFLRLGSRANRKCLKGDVQPQGIGHSGVNDSRIFFLFILV